MGLLSLFLGDKNPVAQWAGDSKNFLRGVGSGLASGPTFQSGLSNAAQLAAVGGQADDAFATQKKAEAKRQEEINMTVEWLRENQPDLAGMVEQGLPVATAWEVALKRMSPQEGMAPTDDMREFEMARAQGYEGTMADWLGKGPQAPELTNDQRNFEYSQANPGFAKFLGQGDAPDMPSVVQEYEYAKAQGYAGSFTDYQAEMKRAGSAPMTATTQKELFEAEDAATAGQYVISALDEAMALNAKAYDGPAADVRGDATALFGNEEGVATSKLKNLTTEMALSQLKTIFGGMPTEGERKVLLELQGSVNQPRAVREEIYKRAKVMAIRRIEDNQRKAGALRSGEYFNPSYGQQAPGGQTSTGVTWSFEP